MRKLALFLFLTMVLAACSGGADGPVTVEIISLDHSPIRSVVQNVQDVAAEFGDMVVVQATNFGTPEGDALAEEHSLEEHTPIAIFVNGEIEFEVDGSSVKFYSFPQGEGTGVVAEGVWTIDDLRTVLEQATQ